MTSYTINNLMPGAEYLVRLRFRRYYSNVGRWETLAQANRTVRTLAAPVTVAAAAAPIGPTIHRSWPLTGIAEVGPTEWWFPVGRGKCEMQDDQRPWTQKRWKPPTADRCGWLSIPEDLRANLDEPVDELAFAVYTALIASPAISGQAAREAPSGPRVKLNVWAVYPHPERRSNSTWRLRGPYATPLTVCLPGSVGQAIAAFDAEQNQWLTLDAAEAQHEGHVCGLLSSDLGLLGVANR